MRRLRQHLRVAPLVLRSLRGLMSRRSLGLCIRLVRRGLRWHLGLPEAKVSTWSQCLLCIKVATYKIYCADVEPRS